MSQRRLQISKTADRKRLPISRNLVSRDRMTVPPRTPTTIPIEILLVAGGGSSGTKRTGGAGAGGLLYLGANTSLKNANNTSRGINGPAFLANVGSTYTISVGGGGTGGSLGSSSSFTYPILSAPFSASFVASATGSTYGGGDSPTAPDGTQGNSGGTGNPGSPSGRTDSLGGGGGAGGVGGSGVGSAAGGNGGAGLLLGDFSGYGTDASNSTAPSTGKGYFAGGGGGGAWGSDPAGGGGAGVGGGGSGGKPGTAGLDNTGGGAGGGNDLLETPAVPNVNQNGGSGIVLIAYPGEQIAIGGTVDTTSRPDWTIHAFTGAGTFTLIG